MVFRLSLYNDFTGDCLGKFGEEVIFRIVAANVRLPADVNGSHSSTSASGKREPCRGQVKSRTQIGSPSSKLVERASKMVVWKNLMRETGVEGLDDGVLG